MYTHVSNNTAQIFAPGCGKEFYQLQIHKVLKHTRQIYKPSHICINTIFIATTYNNKN